MKLSTIVIAATLGLGLSQAAQAANYNTSCGPQLESGVSQTAYADAPTFTLKLKWNITKGGHSSCVKHNQAAVAKADADARRSEAQASQEEADLLQQKLGICTDFDDSNAPYSIREFCGDLLPRKASN